MKTHARDYLNEFASSVSDPWLRTLITETINSNGNIPEARLELILSNLISGEQLPAVGSGAAPITPVPGAAARLVRLTHKAGVNALAQDQTIKFSADVTILHGMNGSGKSSYFRILNEITGGKQRQKILANVHSDNKDDIAVELEYDRNGSREVTPWDGSVRPIEVLKECRVFDASYVDSLLDKRAPDETLAAPFGLHLFGCLVEQLSDLKQRIMRLSDRRRAQKPAIDLTALGAARKDFESESPSPTRLRSILAACTFGQNEEQRLEATERRIARLQKLNRQDAIALDRQVQQRLAMLVDAVYSAVERTNSAVARANKILAEYAQKKETSERKRSALQVLNDLPASDSAEWKNFISAGESYVAATGGEETTCPYCRQSLLGASQELIKAYSQFLSDDSEEQLNRVLAEIGAAQGNLRDIRFVSGDYADVRAQLSARIGEQKTQSIYDALSAFSKELEKLCAEVHQSLEERDGRARSSMQEVPTVAAAIKEVAGLFTADLIELEEKNASQEEKLKAASLQRAQLIEQRSIDSQRAQIELWIHQLTDLGQYARAMNQEGLRTRSVSEISKRAHDELLTEKLKDYFAEELRGLGFPKLRVKLAKGGALKGKATTQLVIAQDHHPRKVISEGEQKAVVLALFLAETRMQAGTPTLIFDDPVNSLDHKIAANFAARLLALPNQIVVFNHNRLFLDAFETDRNHHVCKTIDTDCNSNRGRHVRVYEVVSEGLMTKGVLLDYRNKDARGSLEELKTLLKISPFKEHDKAGVLIRRAVECIIDEVVLNRIAPCKYSNKNDRINWHDLAGVRGDPDLIGELKRIHSRASGGVLHVGTEATDDPLDKDEFEEMRAALEAIVAKAAQSVST